MAHYKVHKRRTISTHNLNDTNQRQRLCNSLFKAGFVYKNAEWSSQLQLTTLVKKTFSYNFKGIISNTLFINGRRIQSSQNHIKPS